MITLKGLRIFHYYQNLLEKQDAESAWSVIEEFFKLHENKEIHHELSTLLIGALSSDQFKESQRGTERHNMILLCESLCALLKALYILQSKKEINQTG